MTGCTSVTLILPKGRTGITPALEANPDMHSAFRAWEMLRDCDDFILADCGLLMPSRNIISRLVVLVPGTLAERLHMLSQQIMLPA